MNGMEPMDVATVSAFNKVAFEDSQSLGERPSECNIFHIAFLKVLCGKYFAVRHSIILMI